MANQISLPQPDMRPGGFIPPGRPAPSPIDNFVQMFLESKHLRVGEDAQKAQTAIATARLKLDQERVKLQQEQERTQQAQHEAQGGALQELIKGLQPLMEQQAPNTPPGQLPPALQALMGGQGGQPGAPQQAPQPQGGPSQQPSPSQIFAGIVGKLPPDAVPEFVKSFKGIADQAQGQYDQAAAFNQADQQTRGLLTPDQRDQFNLARTLFKAGAPKEMWEPMMPQGQINLAKSLEEVRGIKDKAEANKVATKKLVELGLLPQSRDGFIVDDAPKMLVDYISGVRKDARAAELDRAKQDREKSVQGVEGTALEIAASNPDWTAKEIKHALKSTPSYADLPDGVIAKAAFEAPKKAQLLTAPANETVAKARVVYGPGRAALAVVNAMDAKGESLGAAARAAQVTEGEAGKIGLGLGGAAGMLGAGPVGAAVGAGAAGAAGLVAAPLIRAGGRAVMSADQQRLWTAAQGLAATVYRPESGAAVTPDEVRQTLERYIPLSTDKPETRGLKRQLRNELDKTLANIAQLPRDLGQPIIDALLSHHEQIMANTPAGVRVGPRGQVSF